MARGIVLRPDATSCDAIRTLWEDLAAAGIPSIAGHRKGANPPHLSLTVAGHLDVDDVSAAVAGLDLRPNEVVSLSSVGVFPGGVLHLLAVPDERLLAVQRLAHEACQAPSTRDLWSYYAPGAWTPHLTLGYRLSPEQIGRAAELLLPRLTLALTGWTVEIEDGTTGEAWPLH